MKWPKSTGTAALCLCLVVFGAERTTASDSAPKLGEKPQVIRVRLGLTVMAANGPCSNIRCGFPMPVEWPEQKVKIVHKEQRGAIKGVMIREVGGGVRQARFLVSRLQQGESAELAYTLEIQRRSIAPPKAPQLLSAPARPDKALRTFLGASPFIETSHPSVKAEAEKLDLSGFGNDWERVNAIREHTFRRVKYTGVKSLQGAVKGLAEGGDCEERTSVFVALCRLKGIPARSVWMPGHAYAEFYLQDAQGKGYWFPCESVGGRFGWQRDDFLILQKGDRFRDPLKRGVQRYLTETAVGNLGRGAAAPSLRPIREQIDQAGKRWPLK